MRDPTYLSEAGSTAHATSDTLTDRHWREEMQNDAIRVRHYRYTNILLTGPDFLENSRSHNARHAFAYRQTDEDPCPSTAGKEPGERTFALWLAATFPSLVIEFETIRCDAIGDSDDVMGFPARRSTDIITSSSVLQVYMLWRSNNFQGLCLI